ncbi:hypothetical protein B0O99DRAFT_509490 [Bisporella sp. PMI_857]|nr:hypothetical protein B0O99DRAFT_509490 [Bisporella sp. PMI_857]
MTTHKLARELFRGTLRPPSQRPFKQSYTQEPASKNEISVMRPGGEKGVTIVEFSSRAVPMPFLDPCIMQQRIQADKQWEADQGKKPRQEQEASIIS